MHQTVVLSFYCDKSSVNRLQLQQVPVVEVAGENELLGMLTGLSLPAGIHTVYPRDGENATGVHGQNSSEKAG